MKSVLTFILLTTLVTPASATCYYFGTAGSDVIHGRDNCDDVVVGYSTDDPYDDVGDNLSAGNGWDELVGGPGPDILSGGTGYNIFLYNFASDSTINVPDTITDFSQGYDVVGLAGVMWAAGQIQGTFIGTSSYSHVPGQVRYHVVHPPNGVPVTQLEADVDGDGVSDMRINIIGSFALTSADVIFTFPSLVKFRSHR